MVGLIHKILFNTIESVAGKKALAEVKRRADVPGEKAFLLSDHYEDAEWQRLLAAACEVLDMPRERALEVYADHFWADSQQRWPSWFELSRSAREFLKRQPAIHDGFYTGIRDAAVRSALREKFHIEERGAELITHYRSPNRLCGLYVPLARRVLAHYREQAAVEHRGCLLRGDAECEIHVRWAE